jgi:hypothetical protein
MILKKNWPLLVILLLIFNTTSFVAQNTEQSDKMLKQLTKEQKKMLKEQQLFIANSKKEFKNSLSVEQKKILLNKDFSRSKRSKLLKESLSKKQRSLVNINKNRLHDRQIKFKRSLTKRQIVRLRRFVHHRDVHDRKRLIRRLRRLIRDNLNSDN